jgi:hypothetical protein
VRHDEVFDSTADVSGVCSFELCRNFIFEQLKTSDYGRMVILPSTIHVSTFEYGAFTHPLRGRCIFEAEKGQFKKVKRETEEAAAIPIYSPNQLYAMTPVRVERNVLFELLEHWLKEPFNLDYVLYEDSWRDFEERVESEKRIEFRYLANVGLGSDESWMLATLWFDNKPIAVLTYKGEDSEYATYITDQRELHRMVEWVHSLAPEPEEAGTDGIVDPDKPQEFYTEFWNYTLHDFYDVASGLPKRPPSRRGDWGHYGLWDEGVKFAGDDSGRHVEEKRD